MKDLIQEITYNIEEIKADIEYWWIKNDPLMGFGFYRKKKAKWEQENINVDYKKLIKTKRRKLKCQRKKIES